MESSWVMRSLGPGELRLMWLATLLFLACFSPAAASSEVPQAIERAVSWLHGQQLPDGGFGLRLPDGSYRSSASATADAVYVLSLLGEDPAGSDWSANGLSALDALEALAPGYARDAGQAGKVARAVFMSGRNPRDFAGLDLLGSIQSAYDPDSGRYHPLYAFRHAVAVDALWRAGEPVPSQAVAALVAAQRPDGGWSWSFDGGSSDPDSTGAAMAVIGQVSGSQYGAALLAAGDYLARTQLAAGGWSAGAQAEPANSNSTALALVGLISTGQNAQSLRFQRQGVSPLETLLSYLQADGGFVYMLEAGRQESRLLATLDTLQALSLALRQGVSSEGLYLPLLLLNDRGQPVPCL